MRARWATTVGTVVLSLFAAGCGGADGGPSSTGSEETAVLEFCETVAKHRDRYSESMAGADSTDGLLNLLTALSAVGDLRSMWAELAAVAPAEIELDAHAVSEAWNSSVESTVSRDFAAVIATALLHNGAAGRLNGYIADKCGADLAPVGAGFDGLDAPDTRAQETLVSGTFEDELGYTFGLELYGADIVPTVDIANALPGQALYGFAARGTARLTNTTEGRNAPVPADMQVNMGWGLDSPVCEFLGESDNADLEGYCGRAWQMSSSVATLGPGESVDLGWAVGMISPRSIEEGTEAALTKLVEDPDVWAFEIEGGGLASAATVCLGSAGAC